MTDATISLENLEVFSRAIYLRLAPRTAELRRIGRIQDVVRAADDLALMLTSYSAAASADRTGRAEAVELDALSRRLFAALAALAESLRGAAEDYRTRVSDETADNEATNGQQTERRESLGA